jgi:hypothetical protein
MGPWFFPSENAYYSGIAFFLDNQFSQNSFKKKKKRRGKRKLE